MNHDSNTLDYNEYFLPYIIVYNNPYMRIFRANNSLWMSTFQPFWSSFIRPHGYIIFILKIQRKKQNKKNQRRGSPLNPETQQKKSQTQPATHPESTQPPEIKYILGYNQQLLTLLEVANDSKWRECGIACNKLPPWFLLLVGTLLCFLCF